MWAVLAVTGAAWLGARFATAPAAAQIPQHHAAEPLTPWRVAGRVAAVALLALAVVAGRVGSPRELSNIAPALVVGVAWPGLLLASALFGRVWAAADPWDGIARVLRAPAGEPEPDDVWPAAAVALLWTGYLAVPFDALAPRNVGLALALYSLATVAGCLAAGRVRWLARAELFGLLSGWLALWRRGALRAWSPPDGTAVTLGILTGGLLFGELRRSTLWGPLAISSWAPWWNCAGLLGCAAVAGAWAHLAERSAQRHGGTGAAAAAMVPMAAGVALAASLARDRLLVAAQVVLVRASDPLGRGWDLFGSADWPIRPSPLGHTGRDLVQYLLVLAGGMAAAWIAARRPGRAPWSAALLPILLTGLAVLVLLTH